MKGFRKTLGRTFTSIYFLASFSGQAAAFRNPLVPHRSRLQTASTIDFGQKAEGGQTVVEIFANAKTLSGKPIAVRGQVVKYNAGIMGKNWLHIQDGMI